MITYALKKLLESRGLSSAGIKDIADAIERLTDDSYIRETLTKLIANLADGYSEDDTYPVGDYVFYEDVLYKCVEAVTVGESFDPNKWVKTTIEEMFINAGGGGGSSLKNIKDAENGGVVEGLISADQVVEGTPSASFKYNSSSGMFAHVEGGDYEYYPSEEGEPEYFVSHSNEAFGDASHAEGIGTSARGIASHAEGHGSIAEKHYSHAEGYHTVANGSASHAEGYYTVANGKNSHAEGDTTIASRQSQHVFGEFNVEETGDTFSRGIFVEIVGNGTSSKSRSNARTLDWNGNESLAGDLTLGKGTADETTITASQLKALLALLNT